ncbi:MAG: glycine cleavage system protein GcvH [Candidatus Eremiobacteraeota bacterium]|nr:glycine cleavage system protein GcvH [Candidatus Eremiobacteraeota bacterium]
MAQPSNLLYSKEHEWLKMDGDTATVGITQYAQDSLGDIVYVELPRVGAEVSQFGNTGVVESVKAVSDLYTPISGEVVEVNSALEDDPSLVNREPFEGGWLFKVRVKDVEERDNLLSAQTYDEMVADGTH